VSTGRKQPEGRAAESFAAAQSWAALENRVKAMLREARRRYKVQLTLKAKCCEWSKASAAGRIGALADVQDAMKALKTAPPSDELRRSAPAENSDSTKNV